ncbi:CHAD domain-containing protein [Pseudonocardia xishanensis]|uniref:CHAD domain-containing protein n=1 Tax=Pseudonocardia xishanensis TaxID=630995 RepID=A0ABP8RXH8_9PSEU
MAAPPPHATAEASPVSAASDPHSAGTVVLDAVRELVSVLRRLEPAARVDEPDAVHRMRVTTRRLRAVLRTYRRVLDPGRTRPVCRELAWAAGELGAARDAEVVAAALAAQCAVLPADEIVGPVRTALPEETAARHRRGRERVTDCLAGPRYARLRATLDELVADPPFADRAGAPATAVFPKDLDRAARRLRAAVEDTAGRAGTDRDLAVHEVRKQVKRLRYATDVATPELGPPARSLRTALVPVQALLGERQDTVVVRAVLRDLAAHARARRESEFTYGALHARQTLRCAALDEELDSALHRALVGISGR